MNEGAPSPTVDAGGVLERLRALPRGSHVQVVGDDGARFEGWLLPPDALSSPGTVKLKLASGYNVGVHLGPASTVAELPGPLWGEPAAPVTDRTAHPHAPRSESGCPGTVALLTTGGTIASRIDYTTGGVHPIREPTDPEALYPGITAGGPVNARGVLDILSEDMTQQEWGLLATEVVHEFQRGVTGVVIAQGTDTLAYTAAALSFQLRDLPGPVVLVGAQRSIDRPSSDGVANLRAAVRVAREARVGEVLVAMHDGPSDDRIALHRGTRVRKMHSTRRDAFRTLNGPPLGRVDPQGIHWSGPFRPAHPGPPRLEAGFRESGTLLWFRPGLSPEVAEAEVGHADGIILAGTGMGHVAAAHLPWIRRASGRGVVIGMTTQCLEGEVDPFVYSRGRELLQAGVAYLGDISPETAYVKLQWALGRSRDPSMVRQLLLRDVALEFGGRRDLGPMPAGPSPGTTAPPGARA